MLEQRVEKRGKVCQGLSVSRLRQAFSRVCAWNARTSPERQVFLLFLHMKLLRFRDGSVVELDFAPDASSSSVAFYPGRPLPGTFVYRGRVTKRWVYGACQMEFHEVLVLSHFCVNDLDLKLFLGL